MSHHFPRLGKTGGTAIDIIIFGGRRSGRGAAGNRSLRLGPRRFYGATAASEPTAAALITWGLALRPVCDAAFLRLQHGRLFPALV